jgi:hypothetical protein
MISVASSEYSIIRKFTNGRFETKYKIGDKTTSGAIIKEVRE